VQEARIGVASKSATRLLACDPNACTSASLKCRRCFATAACLGKGLVDRAASTCASPEPSRGSPYAGDSRSQSASMESAGRTTVKHWRLLEAENRRGALVELTAA
jgi:hypothetical protein